MYVDIALFIKKRSFACARILLPATWNFTSCSLLYLGDMTAESVHFLQTICFFNNFFGNFLFFFFYTKKTVLFSKNTANSLLRKKTITLLGLFRRNATCLYIEKYKNCNRLHCKMLHTICPIAPAPIDLHPFPTKSFSPLKDK